METTKPADNRQAAIEEVIDVILHAIIAHEAHPDLADGTIPLQRQGTGRNAASVVINPVGVACRNELQALVGLLFDHLKTPDRVAAVIDHVTNLDPDHIGVRRALLEAAWEQDIPADDTPEMAPYGRISV